MSGRRVAAGLVLVSLVAFLMGGCWDNREPRRRAYVLGLGIDQQAGSPEWLTLTLQIPKATPQREQGAKQGGSGGDYFTVQGHGRSIMEALQDAQSRISRELYLGQMRSVAVSDRLSEVQWQRITDELRRNPDIEETMYLVAIRGDVGEMLRKETEQERLPALYFNTLFETIQQRLTKATAVRIWEFWKIQKTPGWHPTLPLAELTADDQIRVAGLTVFRDFQVRGVLDDADAQGLLWLLGQTANAQYVLETENHVAALRSLQASRNLSVHLHNGKPVFSLQLRVTGEVEMMSAAVPVTEAVVSELQQAAARRIRQEMERTLRKLQQEYKSDVLGFGKLLHYRHPAYFDSVDWDRAFPDARVDLSVTVYLARKGTLN